MALPEQVHVHSALDSLHQNESHFTPLFTSLGVFSVLAAIFKFSADLLQFIRVCEYIQSSQSQSLGLGQGIGLSTR